MSLQGLHHSGMRNCACVDVHDCFRRQVVLRHCEERSDEAIQLLLHRAATLDCFAALAMTIGKFPQTFGFFGSYFSTGPPASRHAAKPPAICATGFSPISFAVLAANAERIPPAQ